MASEVPIPEDRRNSEDRRRVQVTPLPFPDRRKGDRRDGDDRRKSPREEV